MSIKFIYKRLGNSKLTVLLSCYFALISIHACSIHSLITSGDITPYANNKVSLIFLCLCWFSGLLLFFFSILSNAICVEVLLGMGMLSRAVGRYSLLHTERLFVSSSRLTFTLRNVCHG
ncbi:MAG: hypothetical protein BGO90_10320 [Legionella sp. 40-6]|nr:hypothetical protein [Legionella sp.]OJY56493.1 MAG: hypothetical protein BGO90_10320 [Legionella sp. 40-6]